MATDVSVILDPIFKLGGTDFSEGCQATTFEVTVDEEETTHARSQGHKERVGKFRDGKLTAKLLANATRGALETYLWNNLGQVVTFETAHRNQVAGAGTPHWTGWVLINKHQGVAGQINGVETYDLQFNTSGVITRATS